MLDPPGLAADAARRRAEAAQLRRDVEALQQGFSKPSAAAAADASADAQAQTALVAAGRAREEAVLRAERLDAKRVRTCSFW